MAEIDRILAEAMKVGASDIHFCANTVPMVRLWGEIRPMRGHGMTSSAENKRRLFEILNNRQIDDLERNLEIDVSYFVEGLGRFRVNIHHEDRGVSGSFRVVPSRIRTVEELNLPEAAKNLTRLHQGLVLVTGPSGCGKSTTLAALIDLINRESRRHIICIEDPVEFVHKSKLSHIDQREVGVHTRSFSTALRAALREDPDVILVGEMRDLETIAMAITASETGHLVFSTLHTRNAAKTIERIINVFPPDQIAQIRTMLAESLAGVVSQQLIRNAQGTGRVLALEILLRTTALATLIRDGNTYRIPSLMQTGKKFGMMLMDEHIISLYQQGAIDPKHALEKVIDRERFLSIVGGKGDLVKP
ncbi:MAG: type IV pilus twitching motility protein PilT [Candidatus Abyssobacteria bacterium SURF_17]|uniref:Type IV pilus twitching motility protein PilT n=1 Tax=Candidatus Abyssobacteria bacterium SURF_17 TaxID=2093361 RepID=A0A419F6M3_9BACT|nr:MAG: type IV pilus twitching motility protein PilT [Candidatus Abyssubacteria bacterium SURF_17]